MHRRPRLHLHLATAVVMALACIWPATSSAHSVESGMQPEQVRAAFVGAGYLGRLQAEVDDQSRLTGRPVTSGGEGPHLVTGYGPSTWLGNVALLEMTDTQLSRTFRVHAERDARMDGSPDAKLAPTNVEVDLEFIKAVSTSVANL